MTSFPSFELRTALICDDVRREDNGKNILIGVYTASIIVPQFPSEVALTLYLQWDPKRIGEVDTGLRLTDGDKAVFFSGQLRLGVKSLELSAAHFGQMIMPVYGPMKLSFQMREGDEADWVVVKEIDVDTLDGHRQKVAKRAADLDGNKEAAN